jgi:FKBP-type peptidyl-prolyl cis-trans isomerase
MNMMRNTYVLVGLLLLCVACKDSEKQTPNGLKFKVVKSGDGVLPKQQEILVFDYVMKDSKDSVWNSTHDEGIPSAIMISDSAAIATENGMVQMFRMLSKGDSISVQMPITKFFKDIAGGPVPPGVDSTLKITYFIQVKDIMKMDQFREFQSTLMEKREAKQKSKDAELISKYLADNNITAQQDTSGIRYVIHNNNSGKKPTAENCVEVKYTGKFLKDGQIFDQNDKIAFPLNGVIPGWRIGIPMLGIGDSATFYIPSGLAYGPQGYPGAIPPDAILIFDVKLLGVGEGFDQESRTCK